MKTLIRSHGSSRFLLTIALLTCAIAATPGTAPVLAQVTSHQKISDTEGGFTAILDDLDRFGVSAAPLGDLDADGRPELAVGAYFYGYGDGHAGPGPGAVFVLSLNANGTVKSHQLITNGSGGFTGVLGNFVDFGRSVAPVGDLDNDGVADLAVGSDADDDGGENRGAVWILFLNADGTVKTHQKISSTAGGFTGVLENLDYFGLSVACLGDFNADGKTEIAVGATGDDDGGNYRGAVWILSLNPNGTVASHTKISSTSGEFTGILSDEDKFGVSVATMEDLDGDTVVDIAVGAYCDDTGGADRGAVWILFLDSDGTVKSHRKIADSLGGFTGGLDDADNFGVSVSAVDIGGCGASRTLAVGAIGDDDGGTNHGAVWLLSLDNNGTVISSDKISDTEGGFSGELHANDLMGITATPVGDLDGSGMTDIVVGACSDDDGGTDRGAVWVMFFSAGLVEPSIVEFDSTLVGKDVRADFMIINQGCGTMTGDIAESCPSFSIISGTHYEIESLDTLLVTAQFSPTCAGQDECTVDLDNGLEILLTGVGLEAPQPLISSVADVGNDQGRIVRIEFSRSGRDAPNSPTAILQYEAFRRIDALPSRAGGTPPRDVDADIAAAAAREAGMISASAALLREWEFVGAIPAHGELLYHMIAPTLADSTVDDGIHWSVFFIRAATSAPLVFFDSQPDSGYSLDNLAPQAPDGFTVAYNGPTGNQLAWKPSVDEDFRYFNVYRGRDPAFVPSPETRVYQTIQIGWTDPAAEGWRYHYKLTAVDFAGNESDPAAATGSTGIETTPLSSTFALHENVPNPFNPSTVIRYDVPAGGGYVTIGIFDVNGRLVRTLVADEQTPGTKTVVWFGDNNRGEDVATGVYLCRMTAHGFEQTRKITLLR
jgi:hypothetical protein